MALLESALGCMDVLNTTSVPGWAAPTYPHSHYSDLPVDLLTFSVLEVRTKKVALSKSSSLF